MIDKEDVDIEMLKLQEALLKNVTIVQKFMAKSIMTLPIGISVIIIFLCGFLLGNNQILNILAGSILIILILICSYIYYTMIFRSTNAARKYIQAAEVIEIPEHVKVPIIDKLPITTPDDVYIMACDLLDRKYATLVPLYPEWIEKNNSSDSQ